MEIGKLNQVADGVWVRQSEWVWTNSIVVRAEDGLILIDPGIEGSELNQLADELDRLGIPLVAGFSTHPHWDHLLWHARFGDAPRYDTVAGAQVAGETREQQQAGAAEEASGVPLLDSRQDDQVGAYESAIDRLDQAARHVDVVVPGHGAVGEGPEVAARLAADRAYIDALRRGDEPVDARLEADWLWGAHQSNLEQARGR